MSRVSLLMLLLSVLSLVFQGGCADDLRGRSLFDSGAGDVILSFSVENVSLTRSGPDEAMESRIDHAYLLFYPKDASTASSVPVAAVKASVSESNQSELTFKMPLRLEPDLDYQLLALANADDYTPDGFSSFGDYIESWSSSQTDSERVALQLFHSDRILAANSHSLPMRGVISDGLPFRYSMKDGAYEVSATLSFRRCVSRIDVANIVRQGFEVEGVALCNWRDAVAAADMESMLGNRAGSVRGVLTAEDETSDDSIFTEMPDADDSGIQQMNGYLYCFPSVCYESSAADKESTAIIIKAKYGDDQESSYYRVNVGMSGNKSELKANTKYLVTIRSVKGRGARTVEEAYASSESLIVLSVVEDWNLDGNFAMDDKGNFIVLSTGRLEFEGDDVADREVKVLASKGLTWKIDYIPDDEVSADAFKATVLSGSSISIGPKAKNTEKIALVGKFRVSASTSVGEYLNVDIIVVQSPSIEGPDQPVIPADMPFALVPSDTERVKIDHVKRTIEIDGFDPECFNSFIDVPFTVYVNEKLDNVPSITLTTDMMWPLEGRMSADRSSGYVYCIESFGSQGTGQVKDLQGSLVPYSGLAISSFQAEKDETVFISVGAMAPDDPPVSDRFVTITGGNGQSVSYALTVKPRAVIIDDVVLTDDSGNRWLVMDRNIQDFDLSNFSSAIGRNADGTRHQAYGYSSIGQYVSRKIELAIPFKFLSENTPMTESQHVLYQGKTYQNTSAIKTTLASSESVKGSRLYWLKRYAYTDDMTRQSPFYEPEEGDFNFSKWIFPDAQLLESLCKKLKVAKMRMYWNSETEAKVGNVSIPICCYLPYDCWSLGDTSSGTYGYFTAQDGLKPNGIRIVYFDDKECLSQSLSTTSSQFYALCRLMRKLSSEELDAYKKEYLGYGNPSHRLSICHPDTHESTPSGWLPF